MTRLERGELLQEIADLEIELEEERERNRPKDRPKAEAVARAIAKAAGLPVPMYNGPSLDAPDVAVCVKPNTEIGFDAPVAFYDRGKLETSEFAVAMFVQVNLGKRLQHHDALQFPDGSIIKLTTLKAGQYAHILQVPVELTRRLDAACQNVFKAYEEFLEGVKD